MNESELPTGPTLNAETLAELTPDQAVRMLQEGNRRFLEGRSLRRSWKDQIEATAQGQHPFAMVLSCIDSRVPSATVFDLGIGDVFVARVAGNVLNDDVLGSMEFACKVAGAKAVVVMGHTACGAVAGAVAGIRLGHLTGLVQKIEPVVDAARMEISDQDPGFADRVAELHVHHVLGEITERSAVLADMERKGEVKLVGAMYDIATGAVRFI